MAYKSNINETDGMFKGEDKELEFAVYIEGTTQAQINADPTANRQDISGWTLEWTLAQKSTDVPLLDKTTVAGIAITNSAQGELTVGIGSTETLDLPHGEYYHTLWRDNLGSRTVLSFGSFALRDPVEEA